MALNPDPSSHSRRRAEGVRPAEMGRWHSEPRRLDRASGGQLVFDIPKSKYSRRLIHLDDQTVAVLRSHLARQAEWRLSVGPAYQDQGFMFTSTRGGLLDPDTLTRAWQRIRRQIGVECRLHDLRHAHATTLIEAGVHIKAVQARLGHSSPSLTMAVYAHVSPQMDKDAAQAYSEAMR